MPGISTLLQGKILDHILNLAFWHSIFQKCLSAYVLGDNIYLRGTALHTTSYMSYFYWSYFGGLKSICLFSCDYQYFSRLLNIKQWNPILVYRHYLLFSSHLYLHTGKWFCLPFLLWPYNSMNSGIWLLFL